MGLTIIQGISYGMLLYLVACGFSLVFGVMGILNLSYGALYMYGAFLGLTAVTAGNMGLVGSGAALGGNDINWVIGLIVGGVSALVLGLLIERLFLARLHGLFNEQTVLTIGFVYILANAAIWIWKGGPKIGSAPPFAAGSIQIGSGSIEIYRLFLIVVGLCLFGLLWWFQKKTRAGAIVRAGMDDKQMTIGLGINYTLVCTAVFMLGSLLVGMAGFLGLPILGAYDAMSWDILIYAVAVVIMGGLGSAQGALIAALVIGLIDTAGKVYWPFWAMFTPYLVIVLTLLIRPAGLVARKESR
jgi:branched-chain amino acid transport system permease protein